MMDWNKINVGLLWTAVVTTVTAVLWMFTTFASASEVEEIKTDVAYGQ